MDASDAEKHAIRTRRLEKLRFWRRACADSSAVFVRYNAAEEDNPLIFFHGDFDMGGLYLRRIAAECGRPIVAVAPHGLQEEDVPPTIEAMAEARSNDIRDVRPAGPYRLGGYCNGALIAYECARILRAQGEEVELVVMLEPSSLNVRPFYRACHRLLALLLRLSGDTTGRRRRWHGRAMKMVWNGPRAVRLSPAELGRLLRILVTRWTTQRRRLQQDRATASSERRIHEKSRRLTAIYTRALASYLPGPLDVPVAVLSTGRDGAGRRCDLYDGSVWGRLAVRSRHVALPGDHSTCLSDHAGVLASHLRSLLAEAPSGTVDASPPVTGVRPARLSAMEARAAVSPGTGAGMRSMRRSAVADCPNSRVSYSAREEV